MVLVLSKRARRGCIDIGAVPLVQLLINSTTGIVFDARNCELELPAPSIANWSSTCSSLAIDRDVLDRELEGARARSTQDAWVVKSCL
jgi:hypothetical protein